MSGGSSAWRLFLLSSEACEQGAAEGSSFPGSASGQATCMFHGLAWLQASSSVKPDPACDIVKNRMHNCNCLKLSLVSCLDV